MMTDDLPNICNLEQKTRVYASSLNEMIQSNKIKIAAETSNMSKLLFLKELLWFSGSFFPTNHTLSKDSLKLLHDFHLI